MRPGSGPLRVRIEGDAVLRDLAEREGLTLASDDEEFDLVARASAGRGTEGSEAEGDRHPPALSPREREILEYLADGWSNAEIASVLRIAERTVRFHLEGLYAKLGVSRRGEAVREAVIRGLVRFEV